MKNVNISGKQILKGVLVVVVIAALSVAYGYLTDTPAKQAASSAAASQRASQPHSLAVCNDAADRTAAYALAGDAHNQAVWGAVVKECAAQRAAR
jgi:hypothetical protein